MPYISNMVIVRMRNYIFVKYVNFKNFRFSIFNLNFNQHILIINAYEGNEQLELIRCSVGKQIIYPAFKISF